MTEAQAPQDPSSPGTELSTTTPGASLAWQAESQDPLVLVLARAARDFNRPFASSWLERGLSGPDGRLPWALVPQAVARAGLLAEARPLPPRCQAWDFPLVVLRSDGQAALLRQQEGGELHHKVELWLPERGAQGSSTWVPWASLRGGEVDLEQAYRLSVVASAQDHAQEAALAEGHWFWGTLRGMRSWYLHAALAGMASNLLALGTAFYALTVYDRVVPNHAIETLWVLTTAVVVAYLVDAVFKSLRAYLVDAAARVFDLEVGPKVLGKLLALSPEERPGSPAQMAQSVRDLDQLREAMGAASLVVLTDLPFLLSFLGLLAFLAGHLVWAPLVGLPLALGGAWLLVRPTMRLAKHAHSNLTERHVLLQEVATGLESLRLAGGEAWVRRRWEQALQRGAEAQLHSRQLGAFAALWPQVVQALVGVAVTAAGAVLISQAQLTTGALIACGILASRALAPLGPLASLMGRWGSLVAAYRNVDQLMQAGKAEGTRLHPHQVEGALALVGVNFRHPGAPLPLFQNLNLQLQAGEAVAILGRMGSGKSTLLSLLAGQMPPNEGVATLDGLDQRQIASVALRHAVATVPQHPYLFSGSIRDNLMLGRPEATDPQLIEALRLSGLDEVLAGLPQGLDTPVGEGGRLLSGGMRQALALARALLGAPAILLLDEATSMMDPSTEHKVVALLSQARQGKTTVLVTHRPALLKMVDRIVVLDAGRVVLDGPRDQVLAQLSQAQIPG